MKPKTHIRKQYLINKTVQMSYAWLLVFCVGLVILVFGMSLWYVNKLHMDVYHHIVGEAALPQAYIDSVQNHFLIGTFVALVVISGLLIGLGIYTSHRIAGPMYRMTKGLNLIGLENQIDTIQIRKRDQLKEMANAFNNMVHILKDKMYQDMRLIDQVKEKISRLHDSLKGESLDIKKLSDQLQEIDRITSELKSRKKL